MYKIPIYIITKSLFMLLVNYQISANTSALIATLIEI